MKILIEGQCYPVRELQTIYNDSSFYIQRGEAARVSCVGYYYSLKNKEVVYMLPKVFLSQESLNQSEIIADIKCLWDKQYTVFKKKGTEQLLSIKDLYFLERLDGSMKHSSEHEWIRYLTISFYNSLVEFKRRNCKSAILNTGAVNELNTNIGDNEYSYLDLVLSFTNFFRKNSSTILLKYIEHRANQAKKPKWEKTIRKSLPIIDSNKAPVYHEIRNKKSIVNSEEELIIYFFSILNHLKEENNLNLNIDTTYILIKGENFKKLQTNGHRLLRKIRHRYFSDILKRMYSLCELYFDSIDLGSIKRRNEEFISFKKYNIVFEDMVDKLLSDEDNLERYDRKIGGNEISISNLKNNDDGKIIDHLFEYEGLIDLEKPNIFYIGDSKYYKPGNLAGKLSVYKQFTYAKNIIQYNIDLSNEKVILSDDIRYRDELTESYNITPNFLLYGSIDNQTDFLNHNLSPITQPINKSIKHSFHWKTRLFDRDTLYLCQYNINYLFILNSYTEISKSKLREIKQELKNKFRINFIEFLSNPDYSNYTFQKLQTQKLDLFVKEQFRILNGNCIRFNENDSLLIAVHHENTELQKLLEDQQVLNLYDIHKEPYKFKEQQEAKIYQITSWEQKNSIETAAEGKFEYSSFESKK
jgi:hypothetical protein